MDTREQQLFEEDRGRRVLWLISYLERQPCTENGAVLALLKGYCTSPEEAGLRLHGGFPPGLCGGETHHNRQV